MSRVYPAARPRPYFLKSDQRHMDMSSDNFKIVFEPGTQTTDPNAPPRKLIGYRIRQDDLGKFTKTPVYEDEQKSSVEEDGPA